MLHSLHPTVLSCSVIHSIALVARTAKWTESKTSIILVNFFDE